MSPKDTPNELSHRAVAFGLRWHADITLTRFAAAEPDGAPADVIVRRRVKPPDSRCSAAARDQPVLDARGVCLPCGGIATLEMIGGADVEYAPGPDWAGAVPGLLYSTLAALLLAWRGAAPLHGSAVEVGGRAVLICGPSGAGKSTLAAALVRRGGRLVSDDLSVLDGFDADGNPLLQAGRPGLRLYPGTAADLGWSDGWGGSFSPDAVDPKVLVDPPCVDPLRQVPLTAVVFLRSEAVTIPPASRSACLIANQFRPAWMATLPRRRERLAALHRAAGRVAVLTLPLALARGAARDPTLAEFALAAVERARS